MQSHRPSLNQHRLRRLALWTLAVLTWIAAMLAGRRSITLRHVEQRRDLISLPWLTRRVSCLLIVRAAQLARMRHPKRLIYWRRGRDMHRAHLIRSALGARLRRALRHKHLVEWIARLIHVLRNLDGYAAPLGRRLRHGLTRLWRNWTPFMLSTPLPRAPAALVRRSLGEGGSPALSDSS